jgi:hypothetical protein
MAKKPLADPPFARDPIATLPERLTPKPVRRHPRAMNFEPRTRPAHMVSRTETPEYAAYNARLRESSKAAGIPEDDAAALGGIELACEVADAWAADKRFVSNSYPLQGLRAALDRLELATRHSALRKVRP